MATPEFDEAAAHRWFAIECNNAAWEFVEKPGDLTAGECEAMLHHAHASCFHWAHAGNEIHHLRAYVLLATAYARAGRADDSIHYAQTANEACEALGEALEPFDRATVYGAMANAMASAGHTEETVAWRKRALEIATSLDLDELGTFEQLYAGTVHNTSE